MKLRELRKKKRLSQRTLADKLGVSKSCESVNLNVGEDKWVLTY